MNSKNNDLSNARELCEKLDPNLRIPLLEAALTPAGLDMKISVDVFGDPASWGTFIADLARYVSDAYQEAHGTSREEMFDQILKTFNAEILKPAAPPQGHLHRTH